MLEVRVKRKLPGFSLDVAFSVNQEILAILGPSGSGKTMTLNCIAGLIKPNEGYIKLNNKVLFDSASNFSLPPQMRKVGFVFQNYALFPHLTVHQNIGYGIRHLTTKEIKDRVSELLEKMNIKRFRDRYPKQLSAGQQQRVAVARALAPEPEVLLLDEPFSALDSLVKERLQIELQALQRFYKGNTLFVTHDLTEGYKLSSRIAIFESGRIVQCDDKANLISSPANLIVARLSGFRNLLAGNINEMTDSNIFVFIPGLGTLRALRHENSCLAPGMPVTIGIRSEYVQMAGHLGENTVCGTIDRIVEEITGRRYFFQINKGQNAEYCLEAVLSESDSIISSQMGKELLIYLPPEHLIVVNKRI